MEWRILLRKIHLSQIAFICISYTLIFNTLSILNYGRSNTALQTNAYPRLATLFAVFISFTASKIIISSRNSLSIIERMLFGLLFVFWGYVLANNYLHGARFSLQALLFPITILGLLISAELNQMLRTISLAAVAIIVICVWMMVTKENLAFYNIGTFVEEKAIIGSRLLTGPFSHPNSLAAIMLIISPAILSLSLKFRIPLLLSSFVIIVLSGSRTSIYSFILWIFILILPVSLRTTKTILFLGTITSFILMLVTPFVIGSSNIFSNRGDIWIESRDYIFREPFFGYGADFYANELSRNSIFMRSAITGHNLMIDLAIKYGFVGLFLLIIFFTISTFRVYSGTDFLIIQGSYLFLFAVSGITETHLNFTSMGEVGFFFWVIFPIVILKRADPSPSNVKDF